MGLTVGIRLVGEADGLYVGLSVGLAVGLMLIGEADGVLVGLLVALKVGLTIGLGLSVGLVTTLISSEHLNRSFSLS